MKEIRKILSTHERNRDTDKNLIVRDWRKSDSQVEATDGSARKERNIHL